jgi:hypothetical protein
MMEVAINEVLTASRDSASMIREFTMKTLLHPTFAILSLLLPADFVSGQVTLLDDTWSDGDRADTALPDESAWFASNAGTTPTLSATPLAIVTGDRYPTPGAVETLRTLDVHVRQKPIWLEELVDLARELVRQATASINS